MGKLYKGEQNSEQDGKHLLLHEKAEWSLPIQDTFPIDSFARSLAAKALLDLWGLFREMGLNSGRRVSPQPLECMVKSAVGERMLWFKAGLWGHSKVRLFQTVLSVAVSAVSVKWAKTQQHLPGAQVLKVLLWAKCGPFGALNCSHKILVASLSRFVLTQAWKQNFTLSLC